MPPKKGFSPGHFLLQIDNQSVALIKDVELPGIEGDVAEYQLATDNFATKQITNFKYGVLKVSLAMGQSKHMWTWLESSINKSSVHKQVSVILADADLNAMNRVDCEDVYITELGFPKCDGGAKDPFTVTVSMRPTRVRFSDEDGAKITAPQGTGKHKNFSTNNFELRLGDYKPELVKSVDAFKFENKVVENWTGKFNEPDLLHTKLTRGDLTVEWSADYAADLQKRADSLFRGGGRGKSTEIDGSLTFNDAAGAPQGSLEFFGCSLKSIKFPKLEGGADKAASVTTVFTVETAKVSDLKADS